MSSTAHPPLSTEAQAARRPLPVDVLLQGCVDIPVTDNGRGRPVKIGGRK